MNLDEVAEGLRERRRALEAELGELTAAPRDPTAAVSFGKRVGDGTTEAVERLSRVGTARSIAATLEEVERALAKLEAGTYGTCDRCGGPIAPERLDAIPWASLCVGCARERAKTQR